MTIHNQKGKWIIFEEIFKVNPQTATSYAAFFNNHDYLREYLKKDLNLKKYPPQEVLYIYENGNMKLCYNISRLEKLARKIFQKTINNPIFGIKANQEITRRSNKIFEIGRRILKTNIKKLSEFKLYNLYQQYYTAHLRMHLSGWYGNLLDYNGIFQNYLLEYLKKKIKPQQSLQEIFSILTQPTKLSNLLKEERDFLLILNKVVKIPSLKKLFQKENSLKIAKFLLRINPKIDKLLTCHFLKYRWLSYQFEGPGWSKNYFIKKLKEAIIKGIDPYKAIKDFKNQFKKIKNFQKKIIKQLKIDKKHQDLFRIFTEIMFLKGYRKDSMFFGCYARDYLLKEISRRLNIPLKLLRYVYPHEMEKIILNKKIPLKILKERFKYHVYFYQEGKGSKILISQKARNFLKKLAWEKIKIRKITEFKGMCASPGKAKGKVTIVNVVKDIKKMKKGNILVSEATSPDLMPAIKKASAIVTNVGGITCHAAIVSRELGIPCVIGTKIATKVLKDGDLVEVDADKGIVKLLRSGLDS